MQLFNLMTMQMRGITVHTPVSGMLPSRPFKSESCASLGPEKEPTPPSAAYTVAATENGWQSSADAEWDRQKEQIIQL